MDILLLLLVGLLNAGIIIEEGDENSFTWDEVELIGIITLCHGWSYDQLWHEATHAVQFLKGACRNMRPIGIEPTDKGVKSFYPLLSTYSHKWDDEGYSNKERAVLEECELEAYSVQGCESLKSELLAHLDCESTPCLDTLVDVPSFFVKKVVDKFYPLPMPYEGKVSIDSEYVYIESEYTYIEATWDGSKWTDITIHEF